MQEIPLSNVRITDSFWAPRRELIARTAMPYMLRVLEDEEQDVPRSHAIENLRIAAGLAEGEFYGMVFQDSDVYKWIETAAYALANDPDERMLEKLREVCGIVAKAQQEDGYLNSYFTLREPDNHWGNLLECHELYCAGHMIEAAVALKEALDVDWLTETAERLAAQIADRFDSDGIPGHQEIEIALMRLYHLTGNPRWLKAAQGFLDRRGQDPDYFVKHTPAHPGISYGDYPIDPKDTVYNQSDMPVRVQKEGRGHAVRCMYMLTAMADCARETGDEAMMEACRRMLRDITERRMYVTGGLGSNPDREQFGAAYELPNDSGYNETCASVAMVFFLHQMLQAQPDGALADLMELELYNGVLASMSADGKHYFYVNPLEVIPGVSGVKEGLKHVKPQRPGWHPCACCPPNLTRLFSQLGRYMYSEGEDTLYAHLLIGGEAETSFGRIEVKTGYPFEGDAVYTVHPVKREFALALHVPGGCEEVSVRVNGQETDARTEDGYLRLSRAWTEGDTVRVSFRMPVRRLYADPRNIAARGCVALARGPFVYCAEGIDYGGARLSELVLPKNAELTAESDGTISGRAVLAGEDIAFRAIPYYSWGNLALTEMRVWLREE